MAIMPQQICTPITNGSKANPLGEPPMHRRHCSLILNIQSGFQVAFESTLSLQGITWSRLRVHSGKGYFGNAEGSAHLQTHK